MKNLVSKLNARELAHTADADLSTSRALPYRPRIYKLRRPLSSPTRGMTLDEALRCSRILGLCVIDVEREAGQ